MLSVIENQRPGRIPINEAGKFSKTGNKVKRDESDEVNRRAKFQLQRAAQGLLRGQRVEHCMRSTQNAMGVGVYRSEKGSPSFGNLMNCGSVWHCPICAARITEHRRIELQNAINTWAKHGGEVYLMSLTFPHQVNQKLSENLALFSDALKRFKNSRTYKNTMKATGGVGSIRALEVTHGGNGWHPHTHDLVFADRDQLDNLRKLQAAWIEMLIKVNLAERSQLNDMIQFAFDIQNGDYAAEYVAKFGHEASNASKILTGNMWGASHEMTKSHAKVGKRLGGRTPFTLLADYIQGDADSGNLFVEFALHFKGKRQLFWSPRLRKELALVEEKSDTEIVEEPLPDRELVTVLDNDQWQLVLSRNARFDVLQAAQYHGKAGVDMLLAQLRGRPRTHSGTYSFQDVWNGKHYQMDDVTV